MPCRRSYLTFFRLKWKTLVVSGASFCRQAGPLLSASPAAAPRALADSLPPRAVGGPDFPFPPCHRLEICCCGSVQDFSLKPRGAGAGALSPVCGRAPEPFPAASRRLSGMLDRSDSQHRGGKQSVIFGDGISRLEPFPVDLESRARLRASLRKDENPARSSQPEGIAHEIPAQPWALRPHRSLPFPSSGICKGSQRLVFGERGMACPRDDSPLPQTHRPGLSHLTGAPATCLLQSRLWSNLSKMKH